jgi:hypothetical protein
MSPMGGEGGQTGIADSPTIQVALSTPSVGTPAVGQFAMSLVTLTSMISMNRESEVIESTDLPRAPRPEADDEAGPSARSDVADDRPGPVIDAASVSGPERGASAAASLPPHEGHRDMVVDSAATGLLPPLARGAGSAEQGDPIAGPPPPPSGAATAVEVEEQVPRSGMWAARLVIAGAIVTAAFRAAGPTRGLQWRKRAGAAARRSDGTIEHPPQGGPVLAHPASRPGTPDGPMRRCLHGSTVTLPIR